MPRTGLLLVVLGVVALVAVSASPADPPGNSPNAKLCQKDGWRSLYTRSGQPFSNAGDCTSYAAHGGQLIVKAALVCLNGGWKALGPTPNQPFTSEQACVDFVNGGGTPVPAGSDLGVTKTVSNATPNVGDTVTFTVTLTNTGPATATGVQVTDMLPAGLTFLSAAPSQGTFDSSTGIWTVGTVTTSTPQTLVVQDRVVSPHPGVNTATVTHSDETDPNAGNNSASVGLHVQTADLTVAKVVGNAHPNVGDTVTFTVTLGDAGPDTATNVAIQDVLPVGFTFVSATPSQGSYSSSSGVWTVGTVTTSTQQTLSIQAKVVSPDPGVNTAAIAHADQFDPVTSNNSAFAGVQVPADLGITKTVSNTTPNVGDTVTFTVTLTDNGPNDATDVTASDLLPAGFTFVSATPSQGTYDPTSGEWNIGAVVMGTPQTLLIGATVISPTPGVNTASISHADQLDPVTSNNSASVGVHPQLADLAIAKTVTPSSASVGDTVTFTVTLTDKGPNVATNVAVADQLPVGFAFVSATPSQGSYSSGSGVWTVGTMTTSTAQTLTIDAQITASNPPANVASVSHTDQFDPDTSNNSASATVTT